MSIRRLRGSKAAKNATRDYSANKAYIILDIDGCSVTLAVRNGLEAHVYDNKHAEVAYLELSRRDDNEIRLKVWDVDERVLADVVLKPGGRSRGRGREAT